MSEGVRGGAGEKTRRERENMGRSMSERVGRGRGRGSHREVVFGV